MLLVSAVFFVAGGALNSHWFHLTRGAAALYVLLPLGAIFFGLFLVWRLFEHETPALDSEQNARLALSKTEGAPSSPNPPGTE
jgi:hypothetical protein